jgi:hypothetical protein
MYTNKVPIQRNAKLYNMKPLHPKFLKILTFTGFICLIIPILILGIWIHSFNSGDNQADRVIIFSTYFPEFLHGIYRTTLLSIAFCIIAIFLGIVCLKITGRLWKVLNIFILIISIALLFLNLFSLM